MDARLRIFEHKVNDDECLCPRVRGVDASHVNGQLTFVCLLSCTKVVLMKSSEITSVKIFNHWLTTKFSTVVDWTTATIMLPVKNSRQVVVVRVPRFNPVDSNFRHF